MEASLASNRSLSKKRKQPPSSSTTATLTTISPSSSNPFTGILTRRKIQKFFFHQNRSGTSRKSRSFPSSFSNPNLCTRRKLATLSNISVVEDEEDDDDEIYHISIKDLRARRVFSKPPQSNDVGKVKDDLAGKSENPRFGCGLIDGKLGESDCKSVVEIPNLWGKCVDLKEGLKTRNPNCDSQLIDGQLDESDSKFDGNHTIVETPNLLEKCVDLNPNLLISVMCDDSRVNCEKEGLIEENHKHFRVNFEEDGLIGETPNLSVRDSRVNFENEGLIGKSPNLVLCESRVNSKSESLDGAKGDCGGQVSNDLSPNLSSKVLQCKSGEHDEDNVQTTPPDAVVLVRQSVLQNRSAESRSPPKQLSPSKGGSAEGKKSFSYPRRNLGLNPCSRLKLFKAPDSFSYRRMLPFLMDLAKDEPSAPKSNPSIKNDTDVEAKTLVSSSQESGIDTTKLHKRPLEPVAPCKPQEMNFDSKEEEKLSLDPKTSDSSAEQAAPCSPINCALEKSQDNPHSDDSHLKTPVSNDLKTKGTSPGGQVVSLEKPEDISPIAVPYLTATRVNLKTGSEPSGEDASLNILSHLSLHAEGGCMEVHANFKPEKISSNEAHSSSKLEAVVSSGGSGFGVAKGILKKNPRGCRGVCNCLSCASFRLNAERAFEFSRNQWLEAEELAMDLMKELSSLRSVLESVNGANDNAIVPIDQVQEICKRVSGAEDIARSRLNQMNEDLHVHCRIKPLQRPRVTFSSSVQEKIIEVIDQAR